jgi:GAF domain-containing protein/HAMP domain-containing protein
MSNETFPRQAGILSRQLTRRVALLSLIAILGLVAVVVIGLVSSLQATQRQLDQAGSTATIAIDDLLSNIKDNLLATSDTLAITSARDEALRRALNRQSAIFELIVIDPQGQVLAQRRRVGEAEPTVTGQPWLATTEIGGIYIGPVDYYEFGVPFADIAVAITDDAGNFSATLVAKVDLTTLWETVTGIQVGETGYIYITDQAGQLLAHPTLQLVQQGTVLVDEIGRTPKDITESGIRPYTGLDGKTVIASGTQLATAPWFVIVEQPIGEALQFFAWLSVILLVLLMVVGLLVYNIVIFTRRRIASPLLLLREGVDVLRQGELTYRFDIQTSDEFGDLASTFNTMAAQLQEMVGSLEQRVADRTRGLQTAADVARATTAVLDRDQLLRRVVDLVRERFNLYYVGLFLVEREPGSGREFAVLSAGTGAAGQQMMAQSHRLEVGGDSMIGQCVARAEARIALDVGAEPARFDNPFLPETRSEIALPLRSRGRAVGAMTVQSTAEAAFDEADIAVMQTVADQVAVALDNARLFAETQAALTEMESIHQRYLGQAWTKYRARRAVSGYMRTQAGVQRLSDRPLPETQQVTTERGPVILSNGGDESQAEGSSLAVPILLRDQLIGTLGLRDEGEERQWSADDIALAEAIAEQLALAADNLRLLDETQRRAAREQLTSEITDKMRRAANMKDLMQTAAQEMAVALGVPTTFVQLHTPSDLADDKDA